MNTSDLTFESKPKTIAQNLMFGLTALTFLYVTLLWLPEKIAGNGIEGLIASFYVWVAQSIIMIVMGVIRKFQLSWADRTAQAIAAPLAFACWIAVLLTEAFFREPK